MPISARMTSKSPDKPLRSRLVLAQSTFTTEGIYRISNVHDSVSNLTCQVYDSENERLAVTILARAFLRYRRIKRSFEFYNEGMDELALSD
jgi:hypothetical protein